MAQHRQNHFFSYEQVLEGVPNAYRKKLAVIARGENPTWHVKNTCLPNSLTVKNPSMIYLIKLPLTQSRAHYGILSLWSSFHLLLKLWNNFVLFNTVKGSPSLETSHFAMFAVKRISALVSGGGTVNHLTGSLVTNWCILETMVSLVLLCHLSFLSCKSFGMDVTPWASLTSTAFLNMDLCNVLGLKNHFYN